MNIMNAYLVRPNFLFDPIYMCPVALASLSCSNYNVFYYARSSKQIDNRKWFHSQLHCP